MIRVTNLTGKAVGEVWGCGQGGAMSGTRIQVKWLTTATGTPLKTPIHLFEDVTDLVLLDIHED